MAISENSQKRIVVLKIPVGDVPILDLVRLHSLYDSKVVQQSEREIHLETGLSAQTLSRMFLLWHVGYSDEKGSYFHVNFGHKVDLT